MALTIRKSDLSDQEQLAIRRLLLLTPKSKPQRHGMMAEPTKPPIPFWYFHDGMVELPYFAGGVFLQQKGIKLTPPFNIWEPHRSIDASFTGRLKAPDPEKLDQDPITDQVSVVKEAEKQLKKYGTTTLALPPGFGKTVCGAHLAMGLKLLTLVLHPRTVLNKSWATTFADFTNASCWVVGTDPPPDFQVIICVDGSLSKVPKEILDQVGTLILDEAHMLCTPSRVGTLLSVHPRYIIAETATLEREDEMHAMIYALCGCHNIQRISTKAFDVYPIRTGIVPPMEKQARTGRVDWAKLQEFLMNHEERNQLICELVLNNIERKILILTWRKEHALKLVDLLSSAGVKVDYMVGTKSSYEDSQVLIGTVGKIGTGFDEKTFCETFNGIHIDLLIMTASTRSMTLLYQSYGRAMRSDFPAVFHIVDKCSISQNHWYEARKWYSDHNGKINQ